MRVDKYSEGDPQSRLWITGVDIAKPVRIRKDGYWWEFQLTAIPGTLEEFHLQPLRRWVDTQFDFIVDELVDEFEEISDWDISWSGCDFHAGEIPADSCGCPIVYQPSDDKVVLSYEIGVKIGICLELPADNNYGSISTENPMAYNGVDSPWDFPGIRGYATGCRSQGNIPDIPRVTIGAEIKIDGATYTIVGQVDELVIFDRAIPGCCRKVRVVVPAVSGSIELREECQNISFSANGNGWYQIQGDRGCLTSSWIPPAYC